MPERGDPTDVLWDMMTGTAQSSDLQGVEIARVYWNPSDRQPAYRRHSGRPHDYTYLGDEWIRRATDQWIGPKFPGRFG